MMVGDENENRVKTIAGAGVGVEATPPFTCTLVCTSVWVGVLETPTIPFFGQLIIEQISDIKADY